MVTVEDLRIAALARCAEYGGEYPNTNSLSYQRIGERQQQLFAAAALTNPEYFGATADGVLDGQGAVDMGTMGDPSVADPVPAVELISRLEVAAISAGPLSVGQEINVVPLTDVEAALAPRVTVRGNIIRQVGTDLAGVTEVRLFYSHRPFVLRPQDGAVVIELPEPFHILLVLDLARFMMRKAASVEKEVRQVALAAFESEEKEAMDNFLAHVHEFTSAAERGRFGRTQGDTKQ